MRKRILSLLLSAVILLALTACGGEEEEEVSENTSLETSDTEASDAGDDSWSGYWYLCGSDLETNGGFATIDLSEMMEVQLPENVNVVIQTGGAAVWQNEYMDPSKLQRWLYNSEGLQLLEEQETANMGDAQTLYEFLSFADENYPADKVAVTFWNHGGGSVAGAAFDELHGLDSLDLGEMYHAFDAVWPADMQNPALELVGFDTCLMATVDVASVFQNFARYLVASEEVEPGNGWLYSGWLGQLADNPAMNGEELGIAICDTYYEGCEAVGTQDQTTLSVTDLTKLTSLLEAYESFGEEAFAAAAEDPGFFAELGRAAAQSENYGGNTREQGYTNMVDLGHLARQTAELLPSAQKVCDALDECVLYRVGGIYRSEATGLSCYYSYNGDIDDFNGYIDIGTGLAFKHLYAYELTGELAEGGEEYLASLDIRELPDMVSLADMGWDGAPLDVDDEGTSILTLGPEAYDVLAGIGFSLYYVDEENDQMMLLGTDNDMTADWENGVFYDNFRGVWGAIDDCLVYMELSFEGEDYNLYSVPILLNGEEYNLQVAYDFEMYAAEELTVTADTAFGETPLFDGRYCMVIEMWDAAGNYAYSDQVTFDCADGEILTTVYEE